MVRILAAMLSLLLVLAPPAASWQLTERAQSIYDSLPTSTVSPVESWLSWAPSSLREKERESLGALAGAWIIWGYTQGEGFHKAAFLSYLEQEEGDIVHGNVFARGGVRMSVDNLAEEGSADQEWVATLLAPGMQPTALACSLYAGQSPLFDSISPDQ
ncbi:MAG: hypothetical protein K9L28_02895 [Synergistales bacterium]|nr:hypothetical protein [Synergistales bacterium]